MRRAVLNLRDPRPVWRIPDDHIERIAATFPARDWEVITVNARVDGRGDGSGLTAEALAAAHGAEAWIGFGMPREILEAASPHLRWAHSGTAGVRALLYPEMVASNVVLTNSAGVHAPAMAETVIAMALHFARGIDFAVHSQRNACWDDDVFENRVGHVYELSGATLGIVGFGGIGREVARRAVALGMRVIATRRSNAPAPEHVQLLHGDNALHRLMDESDIVLVAIPATRDTHGLIDAPALARMRPHSILINVSRGDVIDENALLDTLRNGRIRGAALDVFLTEPLPPDSPFWALPNVLILPHVSAVTPRFWERETQLIVDNIERFVSGRALLNVVDKHAGY
jgi:phosphoglycerate dehydrogenase-like enzyme